MKTVEMNGLVLTVWTLGKVKDLLEEGEPVEVVNIGQEGEVPATTYALLFKDVESLYEYCRGKVMV